MAEEHRSEAVIDSILQFLHDPGKSSFDAVYFSLWNLADQKDSKVLKSLAMSVIQVLCDRMVQISREFDESELSLLSRRIEYYRGAIIQLSTLFVGYDATVEEGEKIADLAGSTILARYFLQDSVHAALQSALETLYHEVLRHPGDRWTPDPFIALFLRTISADLYERIFNSPLTHQLTIFFPTLNFGEAANDALVRFLSEVYVDIDRCLGLFVQESTRSLFKRSFCSSIISGLLPKLLSAESVAEISLDNDLLHQLYQIVQLGDWQADLLEKYTENLRERLDSVQDSDFGEFAREVSSIYISCKNQIESSFDGAVELSRKVYSVFVRFLDAHQFSNQLCLYIHRQCDPSPFLPVLGAFLPSDSSFEDAYGLCLSHRLLLPNPDVEAERRLLDEFADVGVALTKPALMLEDFRCAARSRAVVGDATVDLILLNSFCWPILAPPPFSPPRLFATLFDSAVQQLDFDTDRKRLKICTRCSTVEFSDGTTQFFLPFLHACVLQTILEGGAQTSDELCKVLKVKAIDNVLDDLGKLKILVAVDGRYAFRGPPEISFDEGGDGIVGAIERPAEDPVLFTNLNDQIDAAIVAFVKQRRFASQDEVRAAVYEMVPRKFPVTDDKIQMSIQRLLEKDFIRPHAGKRDCYRYCKQ
jgi:hypothetical protein